jgi:hypothetical protein
MASFNPGVGIVMMSDDSHEKAYMIPHITVVEHRGASVYINGDKWDFLNEDLARMTYNLILAHTAKR